ncbi:MAG TPA: fused MFS/spermidine synthase [Verrucomicrobiae bacterium]|nr:fused MFS/spermidine synthase [Verrucomicrobiae bacterium]
MNVLRATHVLMFFSGALALIYELLWMRRFTSLFGAATPAVASTLAAMFLGMGLGSAIIGRRAAAITRLLRGYGVMELGIALGALLVEPILMAYARLGSTSVLAKTTFALIALLLPAFCMGGTIPLLGHAIAAESRRLGIKVGGLYAANLFGATVGAFSVPFLWLPHLTARFTYGICIAFSALIGLIAILLDRPFAVAVEPSRVEARVHQLLPWPALLAFSALSGLVLFMLQVLWSRMFAQVHENSIYSFSLVLGVLLIALGLGSATTKFFLQRAFAPRHLLAMAWLMTGIVICLTPSMFSKMTNGLSFVQGSWGGGDSYALKLLWLTLPAVLLPTVFAGMVLPLLIEIAGAATRAPAGRVVGALLAVNTAGSVVGALAAAFLLPQVLGLWSSLFAIGAVLFIMGGGCLGLRYGAAAVGVAAVLFGLVQPSQMPRTKGDHVLSVAEGSHGIVAVIEKKGARRMKLNNSYILGGTVSTGDERLQAHIPLLLHPAPRKVAFIGLGTGITAGAALLHPVDSISVVELVPEVISAARAYFSEANLGVCDAPRAHVVADDGRSFLRSSSETFDVVVADLFVPWHQGEALLYTADQFQAVRRRLKPDGIFCQWLPMFQLSQEQFYIVAGTFLDVFPTATVWRGDFSPTQPALALIAYRAADPMDVERRIGELHRDPANPMLNHPAGFWMFCAGMLNGNMPEIRKARRNRENQPWLEILGPLERQSHGEFVGIALEQFLATIPKFDGLSPEHLGWMRAGADVARGTRLLSIGQSQEGAKVIENAVATLPAQLQRAFAPVE